MEHQDELLMWGPHFSGWRKFRLGRKRGTFKPAVLKEIEYVPALASAASRHGIEFLEYWLVSHERHSIAPSIDWMNRDIDGMFQKTWLDVLPCPPIRRGPGHNDKEFVRDFIKSIRDERLIALINAFGPKRSSQDAFHVWICERYGIDGILTLDGKLKDKVRQLARSLSLTVQVVLPSELCVAWGVQSATPEWFEWSTDPFSGRYVKLFERRATVSDKVTYKLYIALKKLARSTGNDFPFRMPYYVIERDKSRK